MPPIADSSAVLDKRRLLPQHQVALTLIHTKVSKPHITSFRWLDLCCGKGQIIVNLEDTFPENIRKKIEYHFHDGNSKYLITAQKKAEDLKFKQVQVYHSEIEKMSAIIPQELHHDFITIINSIHELSPFFLPVLFFECLIRLSNTGTLYVYDMVTINPLELGSVTWTRDEIQEMVTTFLIGITLTDYQPTANLWHHSTCDAWSLEIQKEFLKSTEEIIVNQEKIITATQQKVKELLDRKLESSSLALESYTKYKTETQEDEWKRMQCLFDFYTITRILKK
jgi:hypothetical protein